MPRTAARDPDLRGDPPGAGRTATAARDDLKIFKPVIEDARLTAIRDGLNGFDRRARRGPEPRCFHRKASGRRRSAMPDPQGWLTGTRRLLTARPRQPMSAPSGERRTSRFRAADAPRHPGVGRNRRLDRGDEPARPSTRPSDHGFRSPARWRRSRSKADEGGPPIGPTDPARRATGSASRPRGCATPAASSTSLYSRQTASGPRAVPQDAWRRCRRTWAT